MYLYVTVQLARDNYTYSSVHLVLCMVNLEANSRSVLVSVFIHSFSFVKHSELSMFDMHTNPKPLTRQRKVTYWLSLSALFTSNSSKNAIWISL